MKIVMISNYINHHQIPFAEALMKLEGVTYNFIQTEPMEEERVKMGWGILPETLPYVTLLEKEEAKCKQMIDACDILIVGWMNREDLVLPRMEAGKFTLRMSERIYREGQYKAISPRGLIRKYKEHIRFRKSNVYLLCVGAYVASDFALIHAYPNKKFQFGYFTEVRTYEGDALWIKKPAHDVVHLVWAGRFLPLKHPEYALWLARDLKAAGHRFHLHMIGDGEQKEMLLSMQQEFGLQEEVTFYGFMGPQQVRDKMEECHVHLFTSNYLEGWGAVVNESMNSGCVPVVNEEIGCARFLITHEENGLLYQKGEYDSFKVQVIKLFEQKGLISRYGKEAYQTIATTWNAERAAKELVTFFENYQAGILEPPASGPFSVAPVIKPPKRIDEKKARTL